MNNNKVNDTVSPNPEEPISKDQEINENPVINKTTDQSDETASKKIKNVVSLGSEPNIDPSTKTLYDNQNTSLNLNSIKKTNENIKRARLTTAILKFANLYGPKQIWTRCLIAIIVALIQGFVSLLLIQNTGLYNFGVSSITQGLARLTFVKLSLDNAAVDVNAIYQIVFWLVYVMVNIPLILFSWFKVGKRFTYLTAIYLVTSNILGFALGFIPGISEISIFTNANSSQIPSLLKQDPTANKLLSDPNFQRSISFIPVLWGLSSDASKAVGLLCYGLIFAFTSAFFYTILFVIGASTGGTDFISQYFAKTRHKSLGGILLYANLTTLLIGVLIGSYIPGSMILSQFPDSVKDPTNGEALNTLAWSAPLYFSPNIMATLLSSVIFGILMDQWFPRYRLARVEIYTDKTMEIRSLLLNDRNPHSLSIQDITGGYSLDRKQIIVTISMYIEIPRLIRLIRTVDKNCLLSITTIRGIDGYIYLSEDSE